MALTIAPLASSSIPCPDFQSQDLKGKEWSLFHLKNKKPFLVCFICNHCPYVKAIEDRLIELGHDFHQMGMNMLAISSNDPTEHPEDTPENLFKRLQEKNYPFSLIFDEDQSLAKKFNALCTPDFFLYDSDGFLKYRGRLDDSWKDPSKVQKRELYKAALSLLNGWPIETPVTPTMGCSIKWKALAL